MTSDSSIDIREVIFINPDAESGYEELPAEVGETADSALTLLQNGRVPERKGLWRMLKGKLGGIGEIRINDSTNTFRIYLWLGCDQAIYVLDAGMKKSPTGNEIPQWQQDRLADRRSRAEQDCANHQKDLDESLAQRAARREQQSRRSNP
jgi:phage-related protein